MSFFKGLIKANIFRLTKSNGSMGSDYRRGTYDKLAMRMATGHSIKSGIGKRPVRYVATLSVAGASAATVGVLAESATAVNLLAAVIMPAAGLTTFLDVAGLGAGVLDVPRCLNFKCDASTGDGSLSGASAYAVTVTGTNHAGETIYETIPLNSATVVYSKKAFKTVTRLDPWMVAGVQGAAIFDGSKKVAMGTGLAIGLPVPCQSTNDILEFGVKASAATSYTVTTMASGITFDVGEADTTITADISATATTITIASATGWPTISSGATRAYAELISPDGTVEEVTVVSRTTTTLTVVRGTNGQTARAWKSGTRICWRPGMTFLPAITANDRFYIEYMSALV